MVTDPARVRRTDPGNPEVCPVFDLHKVFSPEEVQAEAAEGCRTAGIGCIQCKGWAGGCDRARTWRRSRSGGGTLRRIRRRWLRFWTMARCARANGPTVTLEQVYAAVGLQ